MSFPWINSDLISSSFIGLGFCLSLIIPDELVLEETSGSNYTCEAFQMEAAWIHTIPPVAQGHAMHCSNIKTQYSTLSLVLMGTTSFCILLLRRKVLSAWPCCFSEQVCSPRYELLSSPSVFMEIIIQRLIKTHHHS